MPLAAKARATHKPTKTRGEHAVARAKLTFKDINLTVNAPVGARVIDISEKVGTGIIYGCREGDCGTCMMQVEEGWNNLTEPSVV
nr:2Fe-2S iron-sulfur cluster binding domain-containing protein [Ectothiorhodospira variabilis]